MQNGARSGVFAARSSWRALVTPKPPDGVARRKKPKRCASAPSTASSTSPALPTRATPQANGAADAVPSTPAQPAPSGSPASAALRPSIAPSPLEAATTITVKHWRRILDGELFATSSRVDWATLMRRTFGFDALRCPTCDARMRVVSTLTDPDVVKKILAHLGMPTEPLPRARARDPTGQTDFGDFAA
jgi:hypothetical protein